MTQRRIYQCAFPYLITFNVLNGEWIFENKKKAELLYGLILNAGKLKNHIVYQFCIMPNHVHMLCQTKMHRGLSVPHRGLSVPHRGLENPLCGGGSGDKKQISQSLQSGLSSPRGDETIPRCNKKPRCDCGENHKFSISDFIKSIRGTFSRKMHIGQIWHPRFYDRIIETDEGIEKVINYIRHNPNEWNLPKKWKKYPYQYYNKRLINGLF
jgi:REP element-mobilizing transposase RayT